MYDIIIIGAGLTGAFCARELCKFDLTIAVLEKSSDVCTEMSRANTAVVYSGYDMKPGTLKARLCASANEGFDDLCTQLDVDFNRTGSLMTAFGEKGEARLKRKLEQGLENRIPGLELISGGKARELEPGLSPGVTAALFSPTTGTVNPWALGIAAAENAVQNGVSLFLSCELTAIVKIPDGYKLISRSGEFDTKIVINAAGIENAAVSAMLGEAYFCNEINAAEYFIIDDTAARCVNRVVFQEREERGGVTIVPTTDGSILVGATESEYKGIKGATSYEGQNELKERAAETIPGLPLDLIINSFSGLRPRARWLGQDSGKSIDSFVIQEKPGFGGFIDLIGIKTPGLTCACKIGEYVADMAVKTLGNVRINTDFNPYAERRPRFAALNDAQKYEIIKADRRYSNIICRCREITEAEVLNAMQMRIPARSVDAVKRRCGTGLGRCQGARCEWEIAKLLSRELHDV